ncbi:hypothetical protein V8C86DRAFT_532734 [Haematococcus lacustris]
MVVVLLHRTAMHLFFSPLQLATARSLTTTVDARGSSSESTFKTWSSSRSLPSPPSDPLNPAQLESYMLEASGLLQVRPPITPAFSGDRTVRAIPFQILSWFPRIVVYPAFVDKARCETIIKVATQRMYPSGLAYRPGEHVEGEQQTRTSKGTFLAAGSDGEGVLEWVEERIAAITMLPRENGEPFNVLQYQHMQHYDSHMDSFDPKDFGPQPSQRIATVLIYLSAPEEGGETVFKKEGLHGDKKEITDWRNCDDGSFKYKPRQGDAVLFWGVTPDQTIDPRSLHGGCPVVSGEKWAMTKWIRSKGSPPVWAFGENEAEKAAASAV